MVEKYGSSCTPCVDQNSLGQPVGLPVQGWLPRTAPVGAMVGRHCRLERLDPDSHARQLYEANSADVEGRMWTYMPYGPFGSFGEYQSWVRTVAPGGDPLYVAIIDATRRAAGVASFMRIERDAGVIEIGHIAFSPQLQRTTAATEAIYLMLQHVFELGYRRCEWKCDVLNEPSRRAASRFGFTFEGVFRQANIVKGRNRDTSWFAMVDSEWPGIRSAFAEWLARENFDVDGKQRRSLPSLVARHRGSES